MTLIVDIQYFANYYFYKMLFNSSNIIFDQYENFQKAGFHNRCTIAGANGPITLSIPVEGGRTQKSVLRDVRISGRDNWQKIHWRGILSGYNRSPWFEFYQDDLSVLYHRPFTFLVDWNIACFEWTLKCLKADLKWECSKEYKKAYPGDQISDDQVSYDRVSDDRVSDDQSFDDHVADDHVSDLRGRFTPRNPNPFSDTSITYRQVFEDRTGFIPNLSILDLLFCEGGKKAVSLFMQRRESM